MIKLLQDKPKEKADLRKQRDLHSTGDTTSNKRLANTKERVTRRFNSFASELRFFRKIHDLRDSRLSPFHILRRHFSGERRIKWKKQAKKYIVGTLAYPVKIWRWPDSSNRRRRGDPLSGDYGNEWEWASIGWGVKKKRRLLALEENVTVERFAGNGKSGKEFFFHFWL